MKPSRIHAVEHIHLEAPLGLDDDLIWFYTEVGCMEHVARGAGVEGDLRFKSSLIEVKFHVVDAPKIDAVARRLTLIVPSLRDTEELLEEHRIAFTTQRGLEFTDQRLVLNDPVGYRLELRQLWSFM